MAMKHRGWTWIGGSCQVFVKVPYGGAPYLAEVKPDGSWEILSHPLGLRAEGGRVPPRPSVLRPEVQTCAGAKSVASAALRKWMRAYQDAPSELKARIAAIEVDARADDYPPPSIRRAM